MNDPLSARKKKILEKDSKRRGVPGCKQARKAANRILHPVTQEVTLKQALTGTPAAVEAGTGVYIPKPTMRKTSHKKS